MWRKVLYIIIIIIIIFGHSDYMKSFYIPSKKIKQWSYNYASTDLADNWNGKKMKNVKWCVYKYSENCETTVNDRELTKEEVYTFSSKRRM